MTIENTHGIDRRSFLKNAAAAASFTVLPAATVTSDAQNSKVELGLVGCGGRGKWIGRLFQEMSDFKVVALHDYFRDRLDHAAPELDVPKDRHYLGLDGYKDLIAGKVDAVAIISPPCFHPSQAVAAMQAGKHTYIAKPVGVDVPGCLAVLEAAKAVKDKSVLIDFQTRNNEFYREAARRVRAGAIGAPVLGQCYYHAGRLGKQCEPGTDLARLRNWVFDKALSGDIIVEQNIHVIDVANWLIGAHPERAMGACGRKGRVDVGDCNDHFSVTYFYPGNVLVDFSSAQFIQGYSDDLCMRLYGTEGTVDTHYGGPVSIGGKKENWPGGKTGTIYQDGAVNNIRDFHASIVEGKPLNIVEDGVMSALTAMLGRKAAYEQRMVTWDEMMADTAPLDIRLNLPPDGPEEKC
jgi:predicted dehydrogenase